MEDRFEKFTILINRIVRYIHKIKSEEMSRLGLKSTHVSCLYYLFREGGSLTAKQLCDVCDEDKAAISRAIDYLELHAFVTCESKFEKRYNSPIVLTPKGKEIGSVVCSKADEILDMASSGLTQEKREIFYECLNLITNNLQELCRKGEK